MEDMMSKNIKTKKLTISQPEHVVTETDDELFIDNFPVHFVSDVEVEPFGDLKLIKVEFFAKKYIDQRKENLKK
ncbi:hypothetical protein MOO45_02735 [Bombilactobacillus folatiphilus]|uniref:Uncharacterized protein n=1 Tax=Bombilactobacillus folatiphilus TaxID=2923362 RepID=A0ABY4PAP2_9LACO|nr:hypothetical protein [Bombilactobacillus folatiphilus]UQS82581.1 hypothetical protein MOO45_02735 [Bombilactobacillus folatiphilus]